MEIKKYRSFMIGMILSLALIFLVVGYTTTYRRDQLIDNVRLAVKEQDKLLFLSLFPKDRANVAFSNQGATSILEYLEDFDEPEQYLDEVFGIDTEAKPHFLFFDSYELTFELSKLHIEGLEKNDQIFLNGEAVSYASLEDRPIFPGSYELKVSRESTYTVFEDNVVFVFNSGLDQSQLAVDLEGVFVSLPAGPENLAVSYKNQLTDVVLDSTKQDFGPIHDNEISEVTLSGQFSLVGNVGPVAAVGSAPISLSSQLEIAPVENLLRETLNGLVIADHRKDGSQFKHLAPEYQIDLTAGLDSSTEQSNPFSYAEIWTQGFYTKPDQLHITLNQDGEVLMDVIGILVYTKGDSANNQAMQDVHLQYVFNPNDKVWQLQNYEATSRSFVSSDVSDLYFINLE